MPERDRRQRKRRFFVVFVLLLIMEVLIALFVHDDFIRPYVGDMLVVIVLYCGVKSVSGDRCLWLPFWIFLFASLVEGLQYFYLAEILGVGNHRFLRIVLGSTFDIKDILCYGVGCAFLGLYQMFAAMAQRKRLEPWDEKAA